jgi:hypothetical protein
MPPLDFPNSPSLNQLYAGPNNVQWQWDGQKWLGTPNTLGPVIVAASPPTFVSGQLWWDSTGGNLYLAYDDGNTQQWVPASNITGLANAATTMDVDKALNDVGRNLIHNALFTVAQRGNGPFTNGITADRWAIAASAGTLSFTVTALPDADRTAIGDEAALLALQNVFTGTGGTGDYIFLYQRIENVRRLSAKTILVSFWAKAASGTPKLGLNIAQNFGTGGSPSAQVVVLPTGNTFTLSTTWTRYTTTIALPSAAGKTFGTNPDDNTQLEFWYSAGATMLARSGNIGVQSGTINLWGVQLEIVQPGQTVPTKLEKRDPVLELQQCQRFYQVGALQLTTYVAAATGIISTMLGLPVTMRSSTISITTNWATQTNASGPTLLSQSPSALLAYCSAVAVGNVSLQGSFTASADL